MITFANQRGSIDDDHNLKIHYLNESFWVKVVAINKDHNKVIGVLMNNLLCGIKWGSLVLAQEDNPSQLLEMKRIVHSVPNTEEWSIL
jgi:hypothetical protein